MIKEIFDRIKLNAKNTKEKDLYRKIIKLSEETGECSQAFLQVTGENKKNKTWNDVREEAIDVAIVALTIALIKNPNDLTQEQIDNDIFSWFDKKLSKWALNCNHISK